jgi:hypothetical protein
VMAAPGRNEAMMLRSHSPGFEGIRSRLPPPSRVIREGRGDMHISRVNMKIRHSMSDDRLAEST